MIAIITDKASIAQQIALSLNIDVKPEGDGYFQGRGFTLVWTNGELVRLSPPEDYGKPRLAKENLPFIPEPLACSVRKKKTAKGAVVDKSAIRQLNIIKQVFDECKSIIVATDAGEEGEWMFRTVYAYLECVKPFKRLWINSLTAKAIREGFKNLGESALYDNLYAAADCRAKADYLINLNAGCAFSLATGMVNHPLGRLQTPTLATICTRFMEHRKFVSTHFFEYHITLEKDGQYLRFTLDGTAKNRRNAEKTYTYLKTFHTAQITKTDRQNRIQPAPMLYSLTALQKEANIRYGFTAAKTMEIVRKLHEEKLVSHPLTDSRIVPEEVVEILPKILRQTAVYCGMSDCLCTMDWENLNRRSVGKTAVFCHHALIPTGIYPGYLPKDDKAVYAMIVSRTLEAFAPDCREEVIRMEAAAGKFILESKQVRIVVPGWRVILDRGEGELKDTAVFPVCTEGEPVRISGWNLLTRKTLPPPLYTEASLLAVTDEAGLGTAATRAHMIETLFSCGYIERRGRNLVPTEKGLAVYHCVKNRPVADMEMAGSWEKTLTDISRGEQSAETFIRMIEIFTKQVTNEILSLNLTKDFTIKLDRPEPGRREKK
ncbi:MAG: DNA topoisomerase III [Bacteroidales bacterium]|jgi:DNA topoisomerase-3|nr:DNA topoisomerase III [Bacteroidales bacterium]